MLFFVEGGVAESWGAATERDKLPQCVSTPPRDVLETQTQDEYVDDTPEVKENDPQKNNKSPHYII